MGLKPFYLVMIFLQWTPLVAGKQFSEKKSGKTENPRCLQIQHSGKHILLQMAADCPGFLFSTDLLTEGSPWDHPQTLRLHSDRYLIIDMGKTTYIDSMLLQADHNDTYQICIPGEHVTAGLDIISSVKQPEHMSFSESLLGWPDHWDCFFRTSPTPWTGLRTQHESLSNPVSSQFYMIRGTGGDGLWSVSRLWLGENINPAWPPQIKTGRVITPAIKFRLERDARILCLFVLIFILLTSMGLCYGHYRFRIIDPAEDLKPLLLFVLLAVMYWWPLWRFLLA